jgi:predicted RNA-binding Zn ribbon-like protein
VTPEVLVTLANLGRPRRPSGTATAFVEPPLASAKAARGQLETLTSRPIDDADLPGLRQLRQVAADAAGALIRDVTPDVTELNALARSNRAHAELSVIDGALRHVLVWDDGSVTGYLARRLIGELGALDPGRLQRCARKECTLLFYDTTRSRTGRWHAENPCGWRARQEVHRGTAR